GGPADQSGVMGTAPRGCAMTPISGIAAVTRQMLPRMLRRIPVALAAALSVQAAQAAVTISTGGTQNMSCSGGVCAPTSSDAVLNVTDLESLLAVGNVKVTTTGSGVQATDIVVNGAFS